MPGFERDQAYKAGHGKSAPVRKLRNGEPASSANQDVEDIAASAQTEFMAAIDSVSDGFALFDAEDRMVFCNRRFKQLNPDLASKIVPGISFEEMLRENIRTGRILDAIDNEESFIRARMAQHRNPSGPLVQLRRDGRWLELREERTPDGATLLVNTDITERKRAEEALRESEDRFRDFGESASDWFWEMDENLRFTYMSPTVERIVGVTPEWHYGRTREELLGDDYDRDVWDEHLQTLKARQPFRDFTYLRVGEGVKPKWLSSSGKPVFDAAGNFLGYRGSGRDITELSKQDCSSSN